MRLHRLEVTAFGPFADSATVDFDRLSEAGLFLLSGPTGAGKTSVLDAVCFALYGDVPGDRSGAKRLRCDQAAPGARPRVELEATLAGRRFRITRSPSWERPKKRGTGTTTEQASVSIAERVDGAWVTHATRLDETGHLVSRLVGMNLTQFVQVAMLPQGRFQAFLRARSEDRQQLLQQLFRTGRFEQVERWLRDRRLALRRDAEAAQQAVSGLAGRVSEVTSSPVPDTDVSAWAAELRATAVDRSRTSAAALAVATETEANARRRVDVARSLTERRARIDAARAEHERLIAHADEHDHARSRLEAARRAAGVLPLTRLATDATRARSEARTVVAGLPAAERPALERAATEAAEAAARLRTLKPRAERLRSLHAETARLEARRADLAAAVTQARTHARVRVETLTGRVDAARTAYAGAREVTLDLREHAISLREQRIHGIAAELAAGLVVGGSCPVCGSCDHPSKAALAVGAPDETAEKDAQRAADDAAATEFLRHGEVRDLEAELAAAVDAVDVVPVDLAEQAAAVGAAVARLEDEAGLLAVELAAYDETALAATAEAERAARSALRALDDLDRAEQALADAEAQLAVALADAGFDSAEAATAAALDRSSYDRLATDVAEHERRLAAVNAVLAEPGADEVAAAELPDLAVLATEHAGALDTLGAARAEESAWTRRAARLGSLVVELDAAVAACAPLQDDLDVVTGLAAFVEGKSADNRLQMRLSAYVLAYRLAQVVAAANLRLSGMSGQRYSLEHTGRRGAGETRGGLSLLVRDDWSGEARDPATLSGGETFVVSLALALGLADVVTQEAGGVDLDTLFVDEGFGALDAETLDDVLDTLDSLRDGGRVVGVVSHVAEMRDRIPTQLLVAKARQGSTLAVSG